MDTRSNSASKDDWIIPLYKIYTDEEDIGLITKITRRGTYWAMGPEIEEFERMIRQYVGRRYCVAMNSGTSSLHALYMAHDIGEGDEVIVPSFSFVATANAVLLSGATPIFADIEDETLGLDSGDVSKRIGTRTKAISPMDYGGMSCKIFDITQEAQNANIPVIEDAAEGLGSSIRGRKVGSISDSAIFSFCGNKVLTTGEGGAAVTDSPEIYEKLRLLRSHGRLDAKNYFKDTKSPQYLSLGYNWRMSAITASLGISQISKIDKLIRMRQNNAQYLSDRLSKYYGISTPAPPEGYEHIYQMYTVKLQNRHMRDGLRRFLDEKRIFSKVYFEPIHMMQLYVDRCKTHKGMLPVTENISQRLLTLPMYPNMTKEELNYMIHSIGEFFEDKAMSRSATAKHSTTQKEKQATKK